MQQVRAALTPRSLAWLVLAPLVVGVLAFGVTYLIQPTFIARTTFLPPQQQQSAAAAALQSLGALSGLAGNTIKSPADQYVALMQSRTVSDRIINRFDLMKLYETKFRFEAWDVLSKNVRINASKKDGLIVIDVEDVDPTRAAAMANQYVEELRELTGRLALTEAQQRRVFFEVQLNKARERLQAAQTELERSGFDLGALKVEPKGAAEGYAELLAQLTSAEIKLQVLQRSLTQVAPEVQQQQAVIASLRQQLALVESPTVKSDSGYVGRYREFKYQEKLFELFSREYEMARVDESREGAVIQVVDPATVPEWKSKPKRAFVAVSAWFAALTGLAAFMVIRSVWRTART